MKYLPLIVANLFRKKARAVLTILAIAAAFLQFGLLRTVGEAFDAGAEAAQADRLITLPRYSLLEMIPLAHAQRIAQLDHVRAVTSATIFPGVYQGRPARFAIVPVDHASYFDVVGDLRLPDDQRQAWLRMRTGVVAGASLARRMGWKIGDRIVIEAKSWPKTDGSTAWPLDVVGLFADRHARANYESQVLMRYDYFDEARAYQKGRVNWLIERVDDPAHSEAVAQAIDALFANSDGETKTQSEKTFAKGLVRQIGDIGLIVSSVLAAVFFTILVVAANSMAQSLRERIAEFGVLKALGFSDRALLGVVLGESVGLAVIGGTIGLLLAAILIFAAKANLQDFGITQMQPGVVLSAGVLMVLLGLVAGLPPALRAMRLNVVDALKA